MASLPITAGLTSPANVASPSVPSAIVSSASIPSAAGVRTSQPAGARFLQQAFESFAEAADSLERSYGTLRGEVARLTGELERSHEGLANSLEENRRMRLDLDRILNGLPCGVLVAGGEGKISRMNPEARRLLAGCESEACSGEACSGDGCGSELRSKWGAEAAKVFERARRESGEQELQPTGAHGEQRWLAVRHAKVREAAEGVEAVSVFILRDVSDARRLIEERDKLRRVGIAALADGAFDLHAEKVAVVVHGEVVGRVVSPRLGQDEAALGGALHKAEFSPFSAELGVLDVFASFWHGCPLGESFGSFLRESTNQFEACGVGRPVWG